MWAAAQWCLTEKSHGFCAATKEIKKEIVVWQNENYIQAHNNAVGACGLQVFLNNN